MPKEQKQDRCSLQLGGKYYGQDLAQTLDNLLKCQLLIQTLCPIEAEHVISENQCLSQTGMEEQQHSLKSQTRMVRVDMTSDKEQKVWYILIIIFNTSKSLHALFYFTIGVVLGCAHYQSSAT